MTHHILLRPDLKTAGGEVNDILYEGRFVGTLSLVYREGSRMSGSIQLDRTGLKRQDKPVVARFAQNYVQQLIDALQVQQCDVIVTYGSYDHIIATGANAGMIEPFMEEHDDGEPHGLEYQNRNPENEDGAGRVPLPHNREVVHRETVADGGASARRESTAQRVRSNERSKKKRRARGRGESAARLYELVAVGQSRNRVEYHVYDGERNWVAEAFLQLYGPNVVGKVNWTSEPSEEEIEHVTDLIVSDFNEEEIDTFALDMIFDHEILETIELTHEDMLDDTGMRLGDLREHSPGEEDYSVILTRDDGDTLTYEIYQQTYGGLPIGTATVDISRRRLTGFIDFRNEKDRDDREMIATLLMRELDKEKDYDSINLTMLHQNSPIDEILFENERAH